MLIVFDLDDTLIPTSSLISPFQLVNTFSLFLKEGLSLENPDEILEQLLLEQRECKSASGVMENFLSKNSLDKKYYSILKKGFTSLLPDQFKINTFPDVKEILQKLTKNNILCLVSRGEDLYQGQKIQKAGIDSSFFSKIIITPTENKKFYYKNLINEFNAYKFIVCGDNLAVDLIPAKELGGITILTSEGNDRINELKDVDRFIDHRITRFKEIEAIIQKYEG